MNPARWQLVQAVFERVADLPAAQHDAALAAACGADRDLRAEVERLLAGDAPGDDPVSRLEAIGGAGTDPLVGTTLGPYRLTAQVASGGMGTVYRGERCDGLFEQEVAIKRIRVDRVDDALRQRFAEERRLLASLQHPCIARLFDGGTTADGAPYFFMEFVRGEPIDRYCERHHLSLSARIRLFLQVCAAVQFAHQRLLVHGDLKPANILVDEPGRPRLLDFGVARVLGEDGAGLAAATPHYASPEQLAGEPATTGHDVYALAVVLAELLLGRRLFTDEPAGGDWLAAAKARRPAPASQMLAALPPADRTALAMACGTTPARHVAALRGDLDAIVAAALHVDPAQRYPSVHELAQDLERCLGGQPVRAHAPTVGYRVAKFVLRHRLAVAAGLLVVGALATGLALSQRSERRARDEAAIAAEESASFHNVADFLMDAFLPTSPTRDAAERESARQRVLAHAARVERQFAGIPRIRGNLLDALGHVCMRLDLDDDAATLFRRALATRAAEFGTTSLDYAASLRSLGKWHHARGDFTAAARELDEALRLQRAACRSGDDTVAAIANDLATCLRNLGALRDAEAMHRLALAERRCDDHARLPQAESLNNLALVHLDLGEVATAVDELREAARLRTEVLGEDHALTAQTCANLAFALWRQGEHDAAFALAARAEHGYRELGRDGARELGNLLASVATMHAAAGADERAVACLREAIDLLQQTSGSEHPAVAAAIGQLAARLHARGDDEEASALWQRAVALRAACGRDAALADAQYGWAVFCFDRGDCATATPLLESALAIHRATPAPDAAATGRTAFVLARCQLRNGDLAAARTAIATAIEALAATPATARELALARGVQAEIERRADPVK